MVLKTKNRIGFSFLVALAGILLGLLIQVSLAVWTESAGQAAARRELALLGRRAEEALRTRAAWEESERRWAAESGGQILADKFAAVREGDILLLVNPWNPLPEGYVPELTEVGTEGHQLDVRCAAAFEQMLADCKAAGCRPVLISSYRTQEMQQELYDNKIKRLLAAGTPAAEAPSVAAMSVAVPGTSEHQLGLAADVIDENYTDLDQGQERTATQQWLMANCWSYGFILRYPNGTTDLTGIIYEPWHYRYIGLQAAEEIHRLGLTLEEYTALRGGR